jgi:hypothetical protein
MKELKRLVKYMKSKQFNLAKTLFVLRNDVNFLMYLGVNAVSLSGVGYLSFTSCNICTILEKT